MFDVRLRDHSRVLLNKAIESRHCFRSKLGGIFVSSVDLHDVDKSRQKSADLALHCDNTSSKFALFFVSSLEFAET